MKNLFLAGMVLFLSVSAHAGEGAFTGTKFYRVEQYSSSKGYVGFCESCTMAIDFKYAVPLQIHLFNWGYYRIDTIHEKMHLTKRDGLVKTYSSEGQNSISLTVDPRDLKEIGYDFIVNGKPGNSIRRLVEKE